MTGTLFESVSSMKFISCFSFLVSTMWVTGAFSQSDQFDTSFISQDTYLVASVNVKRLLDYEKQDAKLRKELVERLNEQIHFDLESLDQILIQVSGRPAKGKSLKDEEFVQLISFVYHFNKPVDKDGTVAALIRRADAVEFQGKTYRRPEQPEHEPCVYFRDDQTMVLAMETNLKKRIAEESSMNPLISKKRLVKKSNCDLLIVGNANKQSDAILKEVRDELKGVFDFGDLISQFRSFEMRIDCRSETPIVLQSKMKDVKGAKRIAGAFEALVALGKTTMPMMNKAIEKVPVERPRVGFIAPPDVLYPAGRQGLKILKKVLDGSKVKQIDQKVELKMTAKGGIPETPILLGKFMLAITSRDIAKAREIFESED